MPRRTASWSSSGRFSATHSPGASFRGVLAVNLHPADVPGQAGGQQMQFVAGAHPAMRGNAGDDRARAADGEGILHPQPERPGARPVPARIHCPVQRLKKIVEPFAGDVGDRTNGRVRQKRFRQQPAQILDHKIPPGGVHQIHFRQRHQPVAQAHQGENVQVLVRLRHDAVVGRDDKNDHVNAVRAGDHVADEIHVAGHIHHADHAFVGQLARARSRGQWSGRAVFPRPACRFRNR